MQNLFAKLIALGILAGGFALTGDLGWLAERGQRVIGAAEVASAPAMAVVDGPVPGVQPLAPAEPAPVNQQPAETDEPPVPAQPAPTVSPTPQPSVTPIDPTPNPHHPVPAGSVAVAEFKPPTGGPRTVSWSDLRPGDRLVIWLASTRHRCLVLDMVDPAAGEALAYEAAAVTPAGHPPAAAGPPRRIVVASADGAVSITCGGMLHVTATGLATNDHGGEWLGPVESLAVIN